jgi:hypothetical protein
VSRAADRVRVGVVFSNDASGPARVAIDYTRTVARDRDVFRVVADASGTPPRGTFSAVIAPGARMAHWIEFRVPESMAGSIDVVLAAPSSGAGATFPPFSVTIPPGDRAK